MINRFILASGNAHKAAEFKELFDENIIEITPSLKSIDVDEIGTSFNENAFIKAKAYFDKYKVPVMSDDSGIVVDTIPDELGIHSARFGGEGLSDKERALLLLDKMSDFSNPKDRTAYFVCVLCFYLSKDEVYFFEGRMHGKIGIKYIGEHGFGYDPIFHPDGTYSEETIAMNPIYKKENSHRAIAVKSANKFFEERDCQRS